MGKGSRKTCKPTAHSKRCQSPALVFAADLVAVLLINVTVSGMPGTAQPAFHHYGQRSSQSVPTGQSKVVPSIAYSYSLEPFDLAMKAGELTPDEQYARRVTVARAYRECQEMRPSEYSGEELFYLGKLCSLGQDYSSAERALSRYLSQPDALNSEDGWSLIIYCKLELSEFDSAAKTTDLMLRRFRYDATVHNAVQQAIENLQVEKPPSAVELAKQDLSFILATIKQRAEVPKVQSASISLSQLYDDGLNLANLLRLTGLEEKSAAAAELADALPPYDKLSSTDRASVELATRRFHLVGCPASHLPIQGFYENHQFRPANELATGSGTDVFVFFPSWCPQCVRLLVSLESLRTSLIGRQIRLYGLITPTLLAPGGTGPLQDTLFSLRTRFASASHLPPIALAPDRILQTLAIETYPTMLIIGKEKVIRYLGSIPNTIVPSEAYVGTIVGGLPDNAPHFHTLQCPDSLN